MKHFFGYILKGLLVILPVGIVGYILLLIFNLFSSILSPLLIKFLPSLSGTSLKFLSFFLMLLALAIIGYLAEFIHPLRYCKKVLLKVPLIRTILGFSNGEGLPEIFQGRKPVLVRLNNAVLPPLNVFSSSETIGISMGEIEIEEGKEPRRAIRVFLPTVPFPLTGYLLLFDPEQVKPIRISIPQLFGILTTYGVKTNKIKTNDYPPKT